MDDIMSKLQSVLSDEESMKQIKELAGIMGSELTQQEKSTVPNPQNNDQTPDFSQLLSGLSGMLSNQNPPPEKTDSNPLGDFDMTKLAKLSSVMAQAKKSDKNIELLLALRPLLKEENQLKIDHLVKIFKLFAIYPLLKENGLLGGDLFGLL
ncbi:MAG: hypothetical protein Q4D35_01725 [Ruminococcus sp.]|nr:hypothetical protein [Ruminococcus sp.]